jgi:hypothetical protein
LAGCGLKGPVLEDVLLIVANAENALSLYV